MSEGLLHRWIIIVAGGGEDDKRTSSSISNREKPPYLGSASVAAGAGGGEPITMSWEASVAIAEEVVRGDALENGLCVGVDEFVEQRKSQALSLYS